MTYNYYLMQVLSYYRKWLQRRVKITILSQTLIWIPQLKKTFSSRIGRDVYWTPHNSSFFLFLSSKKHIFLHKKYYFVSIQVLYLKRLVLTFDHFVYKMIILSINIKSAIPTHAYDIISIFIFKPRKLDGIFPKNIISYLITYHVIRYHNFGAVDLHLSTKDYYPRLDWLQMYTMKYYNST